MSKRNGHKHRELVRQNVLPLNQKSTMQWPTNYREGLGQMLMDVHVRMSIAGSNDLVPRQLNYCGLDVETEDLNPFNPKALIRSIAISPRPGVAYPFIVAHQGEIISEENYRILMRMLGDKNITLIGHNIKYDLNWLAVKLGVEIQCKVFDTLFAEYLLDENNPEGNSLGALTAKYLPQMGDFKKDVDIEKLGLAPREDILIYNAKDADAARSLQPILIEKLHKEKLLPLTRLGMDVIKTLHRMEVRGIWLDKAWANVQQVKLFNELTASRVGIEKESGISVNPSKTNQLKNLLYTQWGYNCTKYTESGGLSCDAEAIQGVIDQVSLDPYDPDADKYEMHLKTLNHIKKYKDNIHLINNFYEPINHWTIDDGRVHATYHLGRRQLQDSNGGTVTGRLSCSGPNLQQIPISPDVRGMFASSPGYWFLEGDYSQLELRVAAYLSQEPVLLEAFANNQDIHTAVMANIKNMEYEEVNNILSNKDNSSYNSFKVERVAIKRINFGILYGVQAARLQRLLKLELNTIWPIERCEELINTWLATYTRINNWIKATKVQAATMKFVQMPLGQKRRLPNASFTDGDGRRALRQAINFPVQSFASWLCLTGLTLLDNFLISAPFEGGLVLQVHDSAAAEIEKQFFTMQSYYSLEDLKRQVQSIMEKGVIESIRNNFGVHFNVPLSFPVTIGERWS